MFKKPPLTDLPATTTESNLLEDNGVTLTTLDPVAELELLAKTYAPPVQLPDNVREGLSADDLERTVFGVTTLLFKTEDNQFIRHELLGSDEGRTEDLCAKVERFGPQYITHNGGTYVIARLMDKDGVAQ